jgi:hypothetical protein
VSTAKQVGRKAAARQARQSARGKKINRDTTARPTEEDYFRWEAKWMDIGVSDDDSCGWTWKLTPADLKEALEFLTDMSVRRWGEIEADETGVRVRHKKHHDMSVAVLANCAQRRFEKHMSAVADSSYGSVFRFRYGGTKRIWGIRERTVFRVLWCDLDHAVYPTDPD